MNGDTEFHPTYSVDAVKSALRSTPVESFDDITLLTTQVPAKSCMLKVWEPDLPS